MQENIMDISDGETEYIPIKVNSGIILQIGAGIYSSVAGAIKELVSNAYDADATNVTITTDYPNFTQFRVVDNGSGMTAGRFRQALQSIGSSLKGTLEPSRITPIHKRPIIGKLGIGMMALSQVCDEATIESQVLGSDTKFIAKLRFEDLKSRSALETEAAALQVQKETFGMKSEVERLLADSSVPEGTREHLEHLEEVAQTIEDEYLGYCMMVKGVKALPGEHGTTVTLNKIDIDLQDSFSPIDSIPAYYRERFVSDQKDAATAWREFREVVDAKSWKDLCLQLCTEAAGLTYQSLPSYHKFLWELALMSPIGYFNDYPLNLEKYLLADKKKQLAAFNFALHVDNRRLLKPVVLPSGRLGRAGLELEASFDYYIEHISFSNVISKDELAYTGYIFWQKSQVEPSSLRGIQIYIRNVGIGLYDQTLLNFSTVNSTSRAGQISGEIYVDEGLERALNIDRNSFRETDSHYLAIQRDIWDRLGSATRGRGVMGKSVSAYHNRKERSDVEENSEHQSRLREITQRAVSEQLVLEFVDEPSDKPYDMADNKFTIFSNSPAWPRAIGDKKNSQRILIPVKAAVASGAKATDILNLLEDLLLSKTKDRPHE